jgi:hypothetical protein
MPSSLGLRCYRPSGWQRSSCRPGRPRRTAWWPRRTVRARSRAVAGAGRLRSQRRSTPTTARRVGPRSIAAPQCRRSDIEIDCLRVVGNVAHDEKLHADPEPVRRERERPGALTERAARPTRRIPPQGTSSRGRRDPAAQRKDSPAKVGCLLFNRRQQAAGALAGGPPLPLGTTPSVPPGQAAHARLRQAKRQRGVPRTRRLDVVPPGRLS